MELYYFHYAAFAIFWYAKVCASKSPLNCTAKSICDATVNVRWWNIPPYIYKSANKIDGFFPIILNGLLTECCGPCTYINYSHQVQGEQELMKNFKSIPFINFPVYGQMIDNSKADKPYLPIIESPGIIYLTSKEQATNTAQNAVMESVTKSWPILAFIYLGAVVSGMLVWALDCYWNWEQFPVHFFKGSWEGFWWSIVSMTTVGYGDRCPKSTPARVFSILYVMMGLVMISLFNGQLTTALTAFSITSDPVLKGENVAVIAGAKEEQYAATVMVKKKVVPGVSELKAVLNNNSYNVMLDTYVAGHYGNLFGEAEGVLLREVLEYNYAYGMILSGSYENSEMQQCLLRELSLNPHKITNLIQETRKTLEFSDISLAQMRKDHLLSPSAPTSKHFFYITTSMIGLFIISGLAWQYWKKFNEKRKVKIEETIDDIAMPSCKTMDELMIIQNKELEDAMRSEVERFYRCWTRRKDELLQKCSVTKSRKKSKFDSQEGLDVPKYDYIEHKDTFELVNNM